jgi:actin-related protein 10
MSTLDTPLSAAEGTPLSATTSLSAFTTPQSHRPANASPAAFPSTTRRSGGQSSHILSMYSTQDRVVLDLGVRFIRAGLSGEPFPRCCIDATAKSEKEVFWEEENWDGGLVEDRLEQALREIYSVYLLIDSKNRKVIVSEETLVGYRIKEGICRVLFTYFQVPSVTFLSSHVLSLASTGLRTGLVIDIGWHDTRILPVLSLLLDWLTVDI